MPCVSQHSEKEENIIIVVWILWSDYSGFRNRTQFLRVSSGLEILLICELVLKGKRGGEVGKLLL